MKTNQPTSVHTYLSEPCPRVVYIYWDQSGTEPQLKAFPNPIRIRTGDGIRWVPRDGQSELTAAFKPGESPFRKPSPKEEKKIVNESGEPKEGVVFKGQEPRSGPAIVGVKGSFHCEVAYEGGVVDLEVQVEAIDQLHSTRVVHVCLTGDPSIGYQIEVDPPRVKLWAEMDDVQWDMEDDFKIKFDSPRGSPFLHGDFDKGNNHSDKTQPGRVGVYKYTVRYHELHLVLDPDVEVEPPPDP
jgi:hypothetical protein